MNCLMLADEHDLSARADSLFNTLFESAVRDACAPSGRVRWPRATPRGMSSSPAGRSTIISFIVSPSSRAIDQLTSGS